MVHAAGRTTLREGAMGEVPDEGWEVTLALCHSHIHPTHTHLRTLNSVGSGCAQWRMPAVEAEVLEEILRCLLNYP